MCSSEYTQEAYRDPASQASMESLINQTLDDLLMSPMVAPSPRPRDPLHGTTQLLLHQQDVAFFFTKLTEMLDSGLCQTAAKTTSDIKQDIQSLGTCIETIETKVDATVARTNQTTDHIQDQLNQLDVRGLSESITKVHEAVCSLIKQFVLNVCSHILELD